MFDVILRAYSVCRKPMSCLKNWLDSAGLSKSGPVSHVWMAADVSRVMDRFRVRDRVRDRHRVKNVVMVSVRAAKYSRWCQWWISDRHSDISLADLSPEGFTAWRRERERVRRLGESKCHYDYCPFNVNLSVTVLLQLQLIGLLSC